MALNSRILAVKSQVFGVMGISNADKELVVKVRCDPLVRTFPRLTARDTNPVIPQHSIRTPCDSGVKHIAEVVNRIVEQIELGH